MVTEGVEAGSREWGMARRYGAELKNRVKTAHEKPVERHPKVPKLGDHWVADPALRSELLQLVMDCPWTEAEILECFLSLRKRSAL